MGRYYDARAALAEIQGDPIHPNIENFEERAAIAEFDGGLTRARAEQLAAKSQGFNNVVEFRAALKS